MTTSSDSSPDKSANLKRLTAEALKADKTALAARDRLRSVKVNLKAAKKQFKVVKQELKLAKKSARRASKAAKAAKRALQSCLERTAKKQKKAARSTPRPKPVVNGEKTPRTLPEPGGVTVSPSDNSGS